MLKRLLFFLILCTLPVLAQQGGRCPMEPLSAVINITASGDNTIIAAAATAGTPYRIKIWKFAYANKHATNAVNVILKDGSTSKTGAVIANALGGSWSSACDGVPLIITAGNAFVMNLSATADVQGIVYYTVEP